MMAGIYKRLFSSSPLHTWDNNDHQRHHAKLRCHHWLRVWKGCSRQKSSLCGSKPCFNWRAQQNGFCFTNLKWLWSSSPF